LGFSRTATICTFALPRLVTVMGWAAFGDLVDQGKAPRLEGGGIDLPVHGPGPM